MARRENEIGVGLIGCGARGWAVVRDALSGPMNARIVALADLFRSPLERVRRQLRRRGQEVADSGCFLGGDAYLGVLGMRDVDCVVLATPPVFRPGHFRAAASAGKDVFLGMPVAVDAGGAREVLAAGMTAERQGLRVAADLPGRHDPAVRSFVRQLRDGAVGRLMGMRVDLRLPPLSSSIRPPQMSPNEFQIRHWRSYLCLSGDLILDSQSGQFDLANEILGGHAVRALGQGGQSAGSMGDVFDHAAIEFVYPGDVRLHSFCSRISSAEHGEGVIAWGDRGSLILPSAQAVAPMPWAGDSDATDREGGSTAAFHAGLLRHSGEPWNDVRRAVEATLAGILGRGAASSGRELTWEQAAGSPLRLISDPSSLVF